MRVASILHRGLLQDTVQIPKHAKIASSEDDPRFAGTAAVTVNSVILNNTQYKAGMLVVLGVSSQDGMTVGWIKKVIVCDQKVLFDVLCLKCIRNNFRYFESVDQNPRRVLINSQDLRSFKPLLPRGTEDSFVFFLVGKLVDDHDEEMHS